MSPASRRGPAANRTPSKQRSDQAASTAGNVTELLGDPATPGVLAALSLLTVVKSGHGHWTAHCPMPEHPDSEPSLRIDVAPDWADRLVTKFHCKGCGANGVDVLGAIGLAHCQQIVFHRGTEFYRQPKERAHPLPDRLRIRAWMNYLDGSPSLRGYLVNERGLTRRTIRQHHIGFDEGRECYVLPVYEGARLVNLRRYFPGQPAGQKMRHLQGHGSPPRLYPSVPSGRGPVVVAEGEWDALVARRNGLLAVSGTHGADTWQPEWSAALEDRHVAFVYDCDKAGREGAFAAAALVEPVARSVRVVDLGLAEKEDLTDWFVGHGRSVEELRSLINATPAAGAGTAGWPS